MIKIPLQFDLRTEDPYATDIDFEKEVLTAFYNIDSLISLFFSLPETWQEGERPYLLLKATEESDKGGYLLYVDIISNTGSSYYYSLTLYYCLNLTEIDSSTNIEIGPLTTFYNTDIYNKKINDHKGGDPRLCIIPINTNCTSLIFTFNDMLNSCGMINLYKDRGTNFINIIINGSKTNNQSWLSEYYNWTGAENINLIHAIELFNSDTGRAYMRTTLGKSDQVAVFQRENLNWISERKYFSLLIGDDFIPDIWFCDGGQCFGDFLREVFIDDVKYFTLWKNVLIKNNEVDNILLDQEQGD